jgi:hypothetical protein
MVPRITSKGRSFKGAGAYFLHDLGKATTSERVQFAHTVNMLTDDPEKALKVMAWTAEHAQDLKLASGQKLTGRKAENPVYTYVLAWAPDQNPDRGHMVEFGLRSLETLGVAEHEALLIAHNDTDHKHLHVIVNRTHPVTGLMAKMGHDQNLLSRLAQTYEEETGRIYCHERVANNRRRDFGEKHVKADNVIRLAETPEYQQRRAERIDAQRRAAEIHAQRIEAEDKKAHAARDMRADFDTAAARDDRRYRAREIERPARDEDSAARRAWDDERRKERERAKGERDKQRMAMKEARRRAWLDTKRAAEWTDYEARQWQALNDKQTDRREGLRDVQADARRKFEERQARKYGPHDAVVQKKIDSLTAELEKKGARAILAKLSGQQGKKEAQLAALQKAKDNLDRQRERERREYEAKQAAQRAEQAKRQEAERKRFAERLDTTKARQDARFVQREAERAQRLGQRPDRSRAPQQPHHQQQATDRAADAQRAAVREHIDQKDREREERAQELGQSFGQAAGLGLGLSR